MAVTNYTETDAIFGFFGFFDLLTTAGRRNWESTACTWTGYMTGTAATMTCAAGGANPFWVSVDGGAEVNPTLAVGVIALFAALSDAPHLVQIRADSAYAPTFAWTLTTGTLFTVTGTAPAIGQGSDLGTGWLVTDPSFPGLSSLSVTSAYGGNITPNIPVVIDPQDYIGGQVVFVATCATIWAYCGDDEIWYGIDNGTLVKVTSVGLADGLRHWRKVATGLDSANAHTYTIQVAQTAGVQSFQGVMVGSSTATFGTTPARQRIDQFGDSITSMGVVVGVSNAANGIYQAAVTDGFIGAAIGKSGQTESGLHTDLGAGVLASRPVTIGAWAVLAIGRNDDTPVGADYTNCINDLLGAGYTKVICRGIEPLNAGADWAISATIQAAVAALGNPAVTYEAVTAWTDVSSFEGTHQDAAGALAEGVHMAAMLLPYLFTPGSVVAWLHA